MLLKPILILLLVCSVQHSSCICKQSYQTTCDSITDYEKFYDSGWSDVVIKSNTTKKEPFRVIKFRTLNSATIIGQIDELGDNEATCVYEIKLKSLNLYQNSIKSIRAGNFLRFLNLHKLGLVNNGIETLHKGAFTLPQIEIIDLSDNKIERIQSGVFTNEQSTRRTSTRKIILKNNKLANIEPHSFPYSLEVLKLDHNRIQVLRNGVLDLPYLRALYLSNNQLSSLPNVSSLYTLRILDVSSNNIKIINPEEFNNTYLEILDLSRNKITTVSFLKSLLTNHRPLEVFLNFNLLQSLDGLDFADGTVLNEKILNLYGNPWFCEDWRSIEERMDKINLKWSKCDVEAFNNNNITFCKNSYSDLENYVQEFYTEMITKGYLLKCDFVRKNYDNLFYKESIDVRCRG